MSTTPAGRLRSWSAILVVAIAAMQYALAQDDVARRSVPIDPEAAALYGKASDLQNQGDMAAAEEQWQLFLHKFGGDSVAAQARHYLGICLMQQDKLPEAIEQFDRCAKDESEAFQDREESLMNLGWCLYNLGMRGARDQLAKAADVFRQLRIDHPNGEYTDQALFHEAECQALIGKPQRAIPLYQQLVRDHPNSPHRPNALYGLTVACHEVGDLPFALACCLTFFQEFPDHELTAEMSVRHGDLLFRDRQYEPAKEAFERVVNVNGFEQADYVSMRIGACLEALNDFAGAAAHFSAFADQFPDSPFTGGATLGAARNYFQARQWDQAVDWYRRAIQRNPQWAEDASRWIARAQLQQRGDASSLGDSMAQEELKLGENAYAAGNLERAKQHYFAIIRNWPDSPTAQQAWYGLAWVNMRSGQLNAAVEGFSQLIDNYPDHPLVPRALQGRAFARQRNGEYAAALADCEVLLAKNPADTRIADGWYVKALCEIGLNQRDVAYRSLMNIRENFPEYSRGDHVLYELAWLVNSNDTSEAIGIFRELVERYPQSKFRSEALIHIADDEFAAGRNDAAAPHFREAIQAAATADIAETAMYKLAYLVFRERKFDEARDTLLRQLESYPDGDLNADATLLMAECWFAEKDYARAIELYDTLRFATLESDWSRELMELHAGQALMQVRQYSDALTWLKPLYRQEPPSPLKWKARFESAEALNHLNRKAEARSAYADVADCPDEALRNKAQAKLDEITK